MHWLLLHWRDALQATGYVTIAASAGIGAYAVFGVLLGIAAFIAVAGLALVFIANGW